VTVQGRGDTLKPMELILTPDQEAFIRQGISSGRYRSAEDAVREALQRWEEAERARAELLASFDGAEAEVDTGQYIDYTDESLPELAETLKLEARMSRPRPAL
jgi:putative addiction module CopG family antidote